MIKQILTAISYAYHKFVILEHTEREIAQIRQEMSLTKKVLKRNPEGILRYRCRRDINNFKGELTKLYKEKHQAESKLRYITNQS